MLSTVDQNISAYEIAQALLQEKERGIYSCPACQANLRITRHYVSCQSGSCSFRAGAAVDIAAVALGSYEAALERLSTQFHTAIPNIEGVMVKATAAEAKRRRDVVEYLMTCGRNINQHGHMEEVQVEGWLRNINVNVRVQAFSLCVMSHRTWMDFREVLLKWVPEAKIPNMRGDLGGVVVVPYFFAPGILASLIAFQPRACGRARATSHTIKTIHLRPTRFSFSGLLDIHPEEDEPLVRETFYEAAEENTRYSASQRNYFAVSMLHNPEAPKETFAWQPEKLLFRVPTLQRSTALVADVCQNFPATLVEHKPDEYILWQDYAVKSAYKMAVGTAGKMRDIESELSAMKLTDVSYATLVQKLMNDGFFREADAINTLRKNRILFTEGKHAYHRIGEEYIAVKDDGARTTLSNFVLEFEKNVAFADTQMFAHTGFMTFNGRKINCVISTQDTNSLQGIETALQRADFLSGMGGSDALPMFREKKYAKNLLTYFRDCVCNLPRVEGVNNLGWNEQRTAYFTPWGKITESGIASEVSVPNPSHTFWNHFKLSQSYQPGVLPTLAPAAADLVSQIIAIMARSYAQLTERAVLYKQDTKTQNTLKTLFESAGQIRPMLVSSRDWASATFMKGVVGYPMLLICRGEDAARINQGMIILGDTGIQVPDVSADELMAAADALPRFIISCVQWCIRTKGSEIRTFQSIDAAQSLSREGAHIIEQACGIPWVTTQPVSSTVEEYLNGITAGDVAKYIIHDLVNQTVEFNVEQWPNLIEDMTIELMQKGKVTRQATVISMDAIQAMKVIHDFYGNMPKIGRKQAPGDLHQMFGQPPL